MTNCFLMNVLEPFLRPLDRNCTPATGGNLDVSVRAGAIRNLVLPRNSPDRVVAQYKFCDPLAISWLC
jgi:hypothetical protein